MWVYNHPLQSHPLQGQDTVFWVWMGLILYANLYMTSSFRQSPLIDIVFL